MGDRSNRALIRERAQSGLDVILVLKWALRKFALFVLPCAFVIVALSAGLASFIFQAAVAILAVAALYALFRVMERVFRDLAS